MSRNGKAAVKSNGQQGQNRGNGRPSRAGRAARDAETAAEPARSAPETQPSEAPVESAAQVSAPSRDDRPEQSIQPGLNAGASNGRQAALERRRKMARQGKKAVGHSKTRAQVLGGMARAGAEGSQQMEALAQSQGMAIDCSNMSGREICRLRRQALSQDGKKAMAAEPRREDKMKGIAATSSAAADARSGGHGTATPEAADAVPGTPGAGDQEVVESGLDQLCERVESGDDRVAPHPMISEVRAICMARREAMAQNGKKAMHRRFRGDQARGTLPHEGAWKAAQRKGLSTREVARQRREERCKLGRGSSEPGRPCGRPRALEGEAPAKVQESTTLSGSPVLGTQVESEASVTGTEAGECSNVTGTEYLGQEYYDRYCRTSPDPNPPKVAYSHTARGSEVSGTEVGRSPKVTGDESGSCESVTGTEYLSTEQYEGFCGTRPEPGPARVSVMRTRQGEGVSGTSVGRSPKVTGDESGSCRSITGSEYLNEQASEVPCTGKPSGAPMKVL
ncbi:MAG: carboxysome shell protein, partial [Thioalkalivibrio sp.]|nr:carboxysome shell protein [Thioalkalivibrio sp.]